MEWSLVTPLTAFPCNAHRHSAPPRAPARALPPRRSTTAAPNVSQKPPRNLLPALPLHLHQRARCSAHNIRQRTGAAPQCSLCCRACRFSPHIPGASVMAVISAPRAVGCRAARGLPATLQLRAADQLAPTHTDLMRDHLQVSNCARCDARPRTLRLPYLPRRRGARAQPPTRAASAYSWQGYRSRKSGCRGGKHEAISQLSRVQQSAAAAGPAHDLPATRPAALAIHHARALPITQREAGRPPAIQAQDGHGVRLLAGFPQRFIARHIGRAAMRTIQDQAPARAGTSRP